MKRMHVHVSVPELAKSVAFYETLFGCPPTVVKSDYAKWMLDDPRVNFAISARGRCAGVDHIGIQVESRGELDETAARLTRAGQQTFHEEAVTCCYAKGDKNWVEDPSGVRWESFYTFGDATEYGEDKASAPAKPADSAACCGGTCGL